jgi:hypothetical protein
MPASEPEKAEIPMSSDTVVLPAGQASVVGGHDDHNHGDALHLLAASHRISDKTGSESLTAMLALKDSEARTADRFATVLDAIKSENGRTRELFLSEKLQDERFKTLRLEVLAK